MDANVLDRPSTGSSAGATDLNKLFGVDNALKTGVESPVNGAIDLPKNPLDKVLEDFAKQGPGRATAQSLDAAEANLSKEGAAASEKAANALSNIAKSGAPEAESLASTAATGVAKGAVVTTAEKSLASKLVGWSVTGLKWGLKLGAAAGAVVTYFADEGNMKASEGTLLNVPSTNALGKYVDLNHFSPHDQALMRSASALKTKSLTGKNEEYSEFENQAYDALNELSPEARKAMREAAHKPEPQDDPKLGFQNWDNPSKPTPAPSVSSAPQNAAPPSAAAYASPQVAPVPQVAQPPVTATAPAANPAPTVAAAPSTSGSGAGAPPPPSAPPPTHFVKPTGMVAPLHSPVPTTPHRAPHKAMNTAETSATDALNDASLAISRARDGQNLGNASEKSLLAQARPGDARDAQDYAARTKGDPNAHFGNEADANLRKFLLGTTNHTPPVTANPVRAKFSSPGQTV